MVSAAPVAGKEPRAVNPVLMLGLVAVPAVFVWLLLLPGYSRSLRIAAFAYAFGAALAAFLLLLVWALIVGLLGLANLAP